MKKAIIVLLALTVASGAAFAQATAAESKPAAEIGTPDPNKMGVETAQQKLKEVSVDKFESAGFWNAYISADEGYIQSRLFEGNPAGKAQEPIPDERYVGIDPQTGDKYVFGIRTDFYVRGNNEIFVLAKRPIPIEGITKTISVWVIGRNYNHELIVILQDFFGDRFELPLGKLNFQGWKKLSVAVLPQNPAGRTGIVQRNFHYSSHMGIKIVGFKIECDPDEAFGTYYVYFDDLRAVTDLFAEDNRDTDDMPDTW
jgi:hypothetical protein